MERLIIIDLGTNTAIFSVVEVYTTRLIITYEKSITTRIGENLTRNNIIDEKVLEKNIKILSEELMKLKKTYNIKKFLGITTDAIRTAKNGPECIERINKELAVEFDVISGDSEAYYTKLSVEHITRKIPSNNIAICDIGGGSTELNILTKNKLTFSKSIELGVVKIEEEYGLSIDNRNLENALNKIKSSLPLVGESPDVLFLCGGTATTVSTLLLGLDDYDPKIVEGTELSIEDINKLLKKIINLTQEEIKKLLKTDTGRSDIIVAGLVIIKSICESFKPKKTIITTFGPRHGYIIDKFKIKNIEDISYKLNTN